HDAQLEREPECRGEFPCLENGVIPAQRQAIGGHRNEALVGEGDDNDDEQRGQNEGQEQRMKGQGKVAIALHDDQPSKTERKRLSTQRMRSAVTMMLATGRTSGMVAPSGQFSVLRNSS